MYKDEQEQSHEITIPIEWHVPDSIQNRYVHNLIVQPGKYELTLFFFETQIPPFAGSSEEAIDFLAKQSSIRSECVSKLTVSPQLIPEIIKALQTGLDNYNHVNVDEEKKDE